MKTNTELVAYVKAKVGSPYWYGCFGQISSEALYNAKKNQYPKYYDRSKYNQGWSHQYGRQVFDCIGLVKAFLWCDSVSDTTPKYNAAQDKSANGMLSACKIKGKISTIPEVAGVLVFMNGHVGVYIGNGEVIEARGHDYGVVKTKLSARPWKNWGYCPYIEYKASTNTASTATSSNCFKRYTGSSHSIVDALKAVGAQTTLAYRREIATANGIVGYIGTAKQNTILLNALKAGTLVKP